ncbi:hypothetical protein C8034_v000924 [Colletotrichum sidae]|uniref:Uncharacterized protein n=1 Tax=Colletotrichum sidae TaxID=1347389 RepID=A0A4R8SX80_9PEZI|nr:hypothetical protein C8034_v000924 [Colletotrichum sidae]
MGNEKALNHSAFLVQAAHWVLIRLRTGANCLNPERETPVPAYGSRRRCRTTVPKTPDVNSSSFHRANGTYRHRLFIPTPAHLVVARRRPPCSTPTSFRTRTRAPAPQYITPR